MLVQIATFDPAHSLGCSADVLMHGDVLDVALCLYRVPRMYDSMYIIIVRTTTTAPLQVLRRRDVARVVEFDSWRVAKSALQLTCISG